MFSKSIVRLTLGYVAGIIILSSIFSVVVYRASTREFDTFQQRQQQLYRRGFPSIFIPNEDPFADERLEQIREARSHILVWLLEFNAVVLVLGAGVGYMLARATIRPIQRSWESQARFTADASHELRTPLTTMRAENDVALRDPNLTLEEAKRLLKSNVEEVSKLTGLSNALLKLTQLQGQQLALQPVTVTTLVARAVERLSKSAEQRKMSIATHVEAQSVQADADLLTEAIVVLLDNAIKYGDAGSAIHVNAAERHHHVHITVTNRGVGIPADDQQKIFERFYRGDSSRTKHVADGFGLGLSLAHDIVTAHRGTLQVQSTPNETTTFAISVPVQPNSQWSTLNPFRAPTS